MKNLALRNLSKRCEEERKNKEMTLNKRNDYGDYQFGQADKGNSLTKATDFVKEIVKDASPFLDACEYYNSEKKLGKAPAVELPGGKLVIAPDVICRTKKGNIFWIEAKDKSQRFYKPDTGADLFQVYGWYKVWSKLNQPVFIVFKDPDFDSCLPRKTVDRKLVETFKKRWELFKGRPYGGWLNTLLVLQEQYPQIFAERSRDIPMFIFYFLVYLMQGNITWEKIINDLDSDTIGDIQKEISAYFEGRLINENEIEAKIKELFS
ncbi:MAG: hypothetical protein PHO67_04510 [Candidatus Omnitrophica bacterium]|nr:hypothetical protein [Candidatus Omnitrophota bacterium]